MNYEEILKCYEGETEQHANTSFEFGLMNELYYQLFRDEFQHLGMYDFTCGVILLRCVLYSKTHYDTISTWCQVDKQGYCPQCGWCANWGTGTLPIAFLSLFVYY